MHTFCPVPIAQSPRAKNSALCRRNLHQPFDAHCCHYGYSYSCARPGKAVICNFWHPGTLALSPERQSARMSKITNDGLTCGLAQHAL